MLPAAASIGRSRYGFHRAGHEEARPTGGDRSHCTPSEGQNWGSPRSFAPEILHLKLNWQFSTSS